MSDLIVKQITEKSEWEKFLTSRPESNFLQSWDWGEFHSRLHHPIYRTGFYKNERLIGVCLSVVEPARRGKYLAIPAGPIFEWNNSHLVDTFFSHIRDIARKENCVFIRIRPQLIEDDFSKEVFRSHGAISAPMHLHAELTNQLDITKSEEELMKNMRKATRYEIRRAEKEGMRIDISQNPDDIRGFYELQIETARRQKFIPFSLKFLQEQFKVFAESGNALLYTALFDKKVLAQAFIIFYGQEAVYHYGASTDAGRKYPGAYAIQWEAIKEAKRRGMTRYNFWGVAPENAKDHRFSGLSLFKRGFGGHDVAYLHARDIVINAPHYFLIKLLETARKKVRHV